MMVSAARVTQNPPQASGVQSVAAVTHKDHKASTSPTSRLPGVGADLSSAGTL